MMGKEGDATPFTPVTVQNISDMLHDCGYQRKGEEVRNFPILHVPPPCLLPLFDYTHYKEVTAYSTS